MSSQYRIAFLGLLGAILAGCAKKPASADVPEEPRTNLLEAALNSFLGVPRREPVIRLAPADTDAGVVQGAANAIARSVPPQTGSAPASPNDADNGSTSMTVYAANPPPTEPVSANGANSAAPAVADVTVVASAPVAVQADGRRVVVVPAGQNPPIGNPDSNVVTITNAAQATGAPVTAQATALIAPVAPEATGVTANGIDAGAPTVAMGSQGDAGTSAPAPVESATAASSTNASGGSGVAPNPVSSAAGPNGSSEIALRQALWSDFARRWGAGPGFTGETAGISGSTGIGAGPGSTGVTAGPGSTGIGAGSGYTGETAGPGSTGFSGGLGSTGTGASPLEYPTNVNPEPTTATTSRALLWFTPWGPILTNVAPPAPEGAGR